MTYCASHVQPGSIYGISTLLVIRYDQHRAKSVIAFSQCKSKD